MKLTVDSWLTLKDISLRRIAAILWCRSDILVELDKDGVESQVEDNMKKLVLPPVLIEEMKYLVKPIRSELRRWKKFHEIYLQIENINMICILKHLCWAFLGNLHYCKTAENLIRHEIFDTLTLYRLACLYCFDTYIPILWEKLPEERKNYFYKEEGPLELSEPQLEFCWPYILKGEEKRLDYVPLNPFGERVTFNQCAFEYSALKGNRAAYEYFYRKLRNSKVRADLLPRLIVKVLVRELTRRFDEYTYDDFPKGKIAGILFRIYGRMKPEQRKEISRDYGDKVLMCILDWPFQNLFLKTMECTKNKLKPERFLYLLRIIFVHVKRGFDYTKVFREFYLLGSNDCINEFMKDELLYVTVLQWFVKNKDSETIKVIFRKLDSVHRETLVSSEHVYKLFCELISGDQWPLVELCLKEATVSKESKEKLKQIYIGFIQNVNLNDDISTRKYIWKHFLHFFHEHQVKISIKRISDEKDLSKHKKTALWSII